MCQKKATFSIFESLIPFPRPVGPRNADERTYKKKLLLLVNGFHSIIANLHWVTRRHAGLAPSFSRKTTEANVILHVFSKLPFATLTLFNSEPTYAIYKTIGFHATRLQEVAKKMTLEERLLQRHENSRSENSEE